MRKTLFALSIFISTCAYSQEKQDTATYAFPLGSKFTLELVQVEPNVYKYHVLNMEPISYAVDYSKSDSLFTSKPIKGTIECIFAKGIDQSGPFKSVLLIRNNSDLSISYKAEIAYDQSGNFHSTSVEPLYPHVRGSELWNDNLTAIVIHKISTKK
jgi:hypothetical protein